MSRPWIGRRTESINLDWGFQPESAEITMLASTQIAVTDAETAEKVVNLIDMLEDLDDVQAVYANADISQELLEKIG